MLRSYSDSDFKQETDVMFAVIHSEAAPLQRQYHFLHIKTGITLYSFYVQVNSDERMPCIFMYYCIKVKYIYF